MGRDVQDGGVADAEVLEQDATLRKSDKVARPAPRTWGSPRRPGEPGSREGLTAWADEKEPRCPGQGHGEREGTRGAWQGSGQHPVRAARDRAGAGSRGTAGPCPGETAACPQGLLGADVTLSSVLLRPLCVRAP